MDNLLALIARAKLIVLTEELRCLAAKRKHNRQ